MDKKTEQLVNYMIGHIGAFRKELARETNFQNKKTFNNFIKGKHKKKGAKEWD